MTTTETTPATKIFLAEVYTKHPTTGEGGWDIKMVWLLNCRDAVHAREKCATLRNFDEIISIGEQSAVCHLPVSSPNAVKTIR